MASSRSCHRRCVQASPAAARDWAGLPRGLLCVVFLKLGTREIMRGAEFACTAWRRVALKEPELWRRIYMPTIWRYSKAWRPMLRAALDRGKGQCVAFTGPCDNHSLLDLAERAPSLKRLDLFDFVACNEVLDEALKQLPLLEDLEISPAYRSSDDSKRTVANPRQLPSTGISPHYRAFGFWQDEKGAKGARTRHGTVMA
ncbi:hypothetical protein BAE44_0019975 [Dichanthelium oligosanthes]|uniref:F-box domain-containing protein n=1 Tax=Dichanthelium oligosanthes TaxID=888268 RepID=A0A1E5V1W7_9POAL|nr:hypothetical protein BAE44_0019975 [Dichanthelium oligosanthes]